ncbi:TPA: hypothetical protein ACFRG8_000527 [Neisseria lactamica]
MSRIYSDINQLNELERILSGYLKLPFSSDSVPGSLMEHVLGNIRQAKVLNTYDFVDVVDQKNKIGWQVKATKATTPITWKRAKIKDSENLITQSNMGKNKEATQRLGNAIINFCNHHIQESFEKYSLDEIGYSRLIVDENKLTYFEKWLCSKDNPILFVPEQFNWSWSEPKNSKKKELLPALHGYHIKTEKKWFAWHGLGENQLHFNGEKLWWNEDLPEHGKVFGFPEERFSQERFFEILKQLG